MKLTFARHKFKSIADFSNDETLQKIHNELMIICDNKPKELDPMVLVRRIAGYYKIPYKDVMPFVEKNLLFAEEDSECILNPYFFYSLMTLSYALHHPVIMHKQICRLSKSERRKIVEGEFPKSRLQKWIESRIANLKNSNQKIKQKIFLKEVLQHFQGLKTDSDKQMIIRMIKNATRNYYRKHPTPKPQSEEIEVKDFWGFLSQKNENS